MKTFNFIYMLLLITTLSCNKAGDDLPEIEKEMPQYNKKSAYFNNQYGKIFQELQQNNLSLKANDTLINQLKSLLDSSLFYNPYNSITYSNKLDFFIHLKEYPAVLNIMDTMFVKFPTYIELYFVKGCLFEFLGRYYEANKYFQIANEKARFRYQISKKLNITKNLLHDKLLEFRTYFMQNRDLNKALFQLDSLKKEYTNTESIDLEIDFIKAIDTNDFSIFGFR